MEFLLCRVKPETRLTMANVFKHLLRIRRSNPKRTGERETEKARSNVTFLPKDAFVATNTTGDVWCDRRRCFSVTFMRRQPHNQLHINRFSELFIKEIIGRQKHDINEWSFFFSLIQSSLDEVLNDVPTKKRNWRWKAHCKSFGWGAECVSDCVMQRFGCQAKHFNVVQCHGV